MTRTFSATMLVGAALALTGGLALTSQGSAAAPANRWLTTTTVSASGGHILGNPDAKTQLIEYVSYTCGHCAAYTKAAAPVLKRDYIAKGTHSVEVRNLVRDAVDMTAAMAARCGPAAKFFGNHDLLMTQQSVWLPKIAATPQSEQKGWYEGSFAERFRKIATRAGFYPLMAKRGINRQALDTCFASESEQRVIVAMSNNGSTNFGVQSTPSFVINGDLAKNVHNWPSLQPLLSVN